MADIANVIESVEDVRNDGLENGKPTVICAVSRQPGANIIQTAERAFDDFAKSGADEEANRRMLGLAARKESKHAG